MGFHFLMFSGVSGNFSCTGGVMISAISTTVLISSIVGETFNAVAF